MTTGRLPYYTAIASHEPPPWVNRRLSYERRVTINAPVAGAHGHPAGDRASSADRLVYQLRPPDLDEYGLVSALREYLHRTTPKGTTITLQAPETLPTLPAAVEVATYRIAQEAINNAIKHARASAIMVTLALIETPAAPLSLAVEICDNGVGLAADHPVGIGLHSMRERAEELGGSWAIGNRGEGGTQVVANLPIG